MALLLFFIPLWAQQKDITQFLGIPINGSKSEMIRKLKAKGFESSIYDKDVLTGEFNGTEVNVHVVTNNNKVCRIFVQDISSQNEGDIIIRFNRLCRQFESNGKYVYFGDYTIPDNEDVGYEMAVNNKRYEAVYYQLPADTAAFKIQAKEFLMSKYTEEQLTNPTEEQSKEIENTMFSYFSDVLMNKSVWFMIDETYGSYRILMYYDNEYNRANGEDL